MCVCVCVYIYIYVYISECKFSFSEQRVSYISLYEPYYIPHILQINHYLYFTHFPKTCNSKCIQVCIIFISESIEMILFWIEIPLVVILVTELKVLFKNR